MSITDFMLHFSRLNASEKPGMIHRLISTSLSMHSEVSKQGKLVELVTSLQKGVKDLFDLQEQLSGFATEVIGATGAKLYLVRDAPYERVERLGNSSLQCSFSFDAPRVSIVQTAAASRMPVTINNAWSHHHYNERWDGPKARVLGSRV